MIYPEKEQLIEVSHNLINLIEQLDSNKLQLSIDRLAKMVNLMFQS